MSYLFCEKCGGYYELQKGENPDDFAECECGGKLTYSLRLDNFKDSDNYKNLGKYNRESIESYKKLKRTIKNYNNEKRRKYWFNRDNLSLKALFVGFLIGLVPVPFLNSIIGGLFVGFIAGGSYKKGALHGLVAGTISLSVPIFILSNPLGSGFDLLISIIAVLIIISIIPQILASLMGTSIRKIYDRRANEIDFNKYPYRFNWWNKMGSKGQATLIIAVYFVALAMISPIVNDFNFISSNSTTHQSNLSSLQGVDEELKVEALELIEKDGYWSTYHEKLKNGLVSSNYINGMWFGKVEIDRDSIQIINPSNSSFVVQYRAVHHSQDSGVYYGMVYLYTQKAVKNDGKWKLEGITKDPQFMKNESYKRWYSQNVWFSEKLI